MSCVSAEGTPLRLTITKWSRVNLAFASLCNTFCSDTVVQPAAAVRGSKINTMFLCCVYVSKQGSVRWVSDKRCYWSGSMTGAALGLWLQLACQAAGLDECSYIIL